MMIWLPLERAQDKLDNPGANFFPGPCSGPFNAVQLRGPQVHSLTIRSLTSVSTRSDGAVLWAAYDAPRISSKRPDSNNSSRPLHARPGPSEQQFGIGMRKHNAFSQ